MPARLIELLGGQADLVLSDIAPNTTGHTATDHMRIVALAELAFDFAAAGARARRRLRGESVPGRLGAAIARADEAGIRDGPPRQAAGQPHANRANFTSSRRGFAARGPSVSEPAALGAARPRDAVSCTEACGSTRGD